MSIGNRFTNFLTGVEGVVKELGDNVIVPGLSFLGGTAGKIGKHTIDFSADTINKLSQVDFEGIGKSLYGKGKKIGKSTLSGLIDEAERTGYTLELFRSALLGDAPLTTALFGEENIASKLLKGTAILKRDESSLLLGMKFTGLGTALAVPGALMAGTPKAVKTYMDLHRGTSDNRIYTNAPINTYGQALGNSYANNAGATGDLVFALHNQRHTGII